MKRLATRIGIAVTLFVICFGSPAFATTITFDFFTGFNTSEAPYIEQGFSFSHVAPGSTVPGTNPHFGDGAGPPAGIGSLSWHDGGTNGDTLWVVMAPIGGGTFDFVSFDLIQFKSVDDPDGGFSIVASGFTGQGHTTPGTKLVNWNDISFVIFGLFDGLLGPTEQSVAIDNVVVEDVQLVPVPAAFWLFGTALVGLIGFSKRRKSA